MTNKTEEHAWHVEYAKRSIATHAEDAEKDIRAKIEWIRRNLDEAERRLDAGEMPNTCGILQGSAMELEMALARFAAIRDLKPTVAIFTNAIDALMAKEER